MFYRFLRWCPGALGLLLRKKLYPRYVKACGRNVLFGRFVDLRAGRGTISIGSGVVVNDFAILQGNPGARDGAGLIIEDNVFIGAGTTINASEGTIRIASGSNIGSGCSIQSNTSVVLEKNVLVAAFCDIGKICPGDETLPPGEEASGGDPAKGTTIGQGCWLGVRAKVAAGLRIGENTIVGAHSTVTTDLPAQVVVIGNPAEVLYKRV